MVKAQALDFKGALIGGKVAPKFEVLDVEISAEFEAATSFEALEFAGMLCAATSRAASAQTIYFAFQPQVHGEFIDERAKADPLNCSENLEFRGFHARVLFDCVSQALRRSARASVCGEKNASSGVNMPGRAGGNKICAAATAMRDGANELDIAGAM